MVYKIKITIFILITLLLLFLCLTHKNNIETNILNTLLPKEITNSSNIAKLANKSSSIVKIVFEGQNEDDIQQLKDDFLLKIDKNFFEYNKPDVSKLLDIYLAHSENFLSVKTKNLLKQEKYDEIYKNSLKKLYGASAIQLNTFDKDPYYLSEDFILSNKEFSSKVTKDNFDYLQLKIKSLEGLSPNLINKKIKELILIQKELTSKKSKIYLSGTPIHSYYTSRNSIISINIICILSTLLIIFLTYCNFRNCKPLIPMAISIAFGMLCGLCAVKLLFSDFQIITMVFSSTLIGIGIDYSYHYFYTGKNKNFKKNLIFSFLTSIIPFTLLYFSQIDLLKQVAIFIIFGLFGIFLTVLYLYPCFKINANSSTIKINDKIYKICSIILIILSILGVFRFKFNDTLTSLYSPSGTLQKAELLYSQISGENLGNTQIITTKIEDEENITKELIRNNINYISISKFLPSKEVQKENFELTKKLYKNNLNKYSNILTEKQIKTLTDLKFTPIEFNAKDYSFLQDFYLNKYTSIIFVFSKDKLNIRGNNCEIINFKSDIQNYMKKYRKHLMILLPIVLLVLYFILAFLYDFEKALKILTPSIMGTLGAITITSLLIGEINLFCIIAIFLTIGFTIDYSIFRINGEENTEKAIIISCITTSFSFLLLCFCGFKLLSSMACILFFGIITSYFTGYYIIFKNNHDKI